MVNFKGRFHGNGTSLQFYTVPNLNPQDLSYRMIYHLFEDDVWDTNSEFATDTVNSIFDHLYLFFSKEDLYIFITFSVLELMFLSPFWN